MIQFSTHSSILLCEYCTQVLFEVTNNNFTAFFAYRDRFVLMLCSVSSVKMCKKTSLNQVQRDGIVTLYKESYSERKIGAKCDVCKRAIHTAIVNWRLRRNYSDSKRSGKPKKTTVRDDRLMKRMVVRSPTSSVKKVQSALLTKGVKVNIFKKD